MNDKFINALSYAFGSKFEKFQQIIQFESENDFLIINSNEFQKKLAKYNEKETGRKEKGVYYTPEDTTDFITANCFCSTLIEDFKISNYKSCINNLLKLDISIILKFLFEMTVFDPTSGCGEFLMSALRIKLFVLNKLRLTSQENVIKICKTIHGNDINNESNSVSIARMFLTVFKILKPDNYIEFINEISKNFYNLDMSVVHCDLNRFDFLIGNPPYVEKGKECKYGNLYADVLLNSLNYLKKQAAIGFIIPISFCSTPRMNDFRTKLKDIIPNLNVLSYADRPSCLFNGVHQKLNIIIGNTNEEKQQLNVSTYNYWYKTERKELFNRTDLFNLPETILNSYPKINSELEYKVLKKLTLKTDNSRSLMDLLTENESETSIYFNMRAFFWMKAFSFNPGSAEYKVFNCKKEYKDFLLCFINSSLFYFYWVAISDCWHITSKELSGIQIDITKIDFESYVILSKKLEEMLEKTKEFIGTKQADFAYKHKLCKSFIDLIDDKIGFDLGLGKDALKHIKNYAIRYRTGD